jgi:hypothetical protein
VTDGGIAVEFLIASNLITKDIKLTNMIEIRRAHYDKN